MKFWQSITWCETEQLCGVAQFAEQLGFEGLIGADHALYPKHLAPNYPYSKTGLPPQTAHSEYADMWTSLAAMAAVTQTIKLTCGVYVLPCRHPIEVAKQAATLSILSKGRFVLGVGSGWMKEEFEAYGVDFKTRGKRLDEMLDIMQNLWRGDMFAFEGEFFSFPEIQISPISSFPQPIYFGGSATVALRRAARLGDGWIGAGNTPEEVPVIIQKLQALRCEYGREQQSFETIIGLYAQPTIELFKRLEEQGMTASINLPFAFAIAEKSSLDDKKRMMEAFAEKIIRHF